jgi:hypothetical protein
MIKKKYRWILQLFKDDKKINELFVKMSNRPPMEWHGHEIIKCIHEITLNYSSEYPLNFQDVVPRIVLVDGIGNPIEEWDLLNCKPSFEYNSYDEHEVILQFEDVKYNWRIK